MRWRLRGQQPPNRSRERRRNRPRGGSRRPRRQCHLIPLSELVLFRYMTVVHGAIGGTTTLNAKRRKAGVAQHPEDIATSTRWRTRTRPRPSVPPRPLDHQLRRGRIIPGAVGPPTVAKWSFDPANLREHHCTRDCLHVADNIQLISGRFYQRSSGMGRRLSRQRWTESRMSRAGANSSQVIWLPGPYRTPGWHSNRS